jgi:hypothetical protein
MILYNFFLKKLYKGLKNNFVKKMIKNVLGKFYEILPDFFKK